MKADLFQSCGHCWVFQICWHIECSTFTASSFRIWNSSAGILSPPLALFLMVLPKAHLTAHSGMSDSRWVITPSRLTGSLRSFLYSSSVYSCHLLLLSSASVISVLYCAHLCNLKFCILGISNFLEEFTVFPILLFSSISLPWSLRKAFLSCHYLELFIQKGISFLFSFAFSFFSQLFVRPPQTMILPFCISLSWGWSWSLPPVQCHKPLSIVLQALYQV